MTLGGSLVFGDDTDVFTLRAGIVGRDVFLGVGSNSGTGDDIFTLAGGTITRNIYGDADQDTINIDSGTVGGNVYGRNGDDVINFTGGTVTRDIRGDNGDDIITLSGTAALGRHIIGGNGNDTINLDSGNVGSNVRGQNGDDIFNWSAGSLVGQFQGGDGSDTAIISAATYDGTNRLNGGDNRSALDGQVDSLVFQGLGGTAIVSSRLTNWENITVDGGNVSFAGTLTVGQTVETTTRLLLTNAGTLNAGTVFTLNGNLATSSGGTFDGTGGGAGTYTIRGSVANDGLITTQDGAVGDVFTINNDYAGAGDLLIDVDFSSDMADVLAVNGDVTGGVTTVNVNALGAPSGNDILVVDVTGASPAGMFVLANGPLNVGGNVYDLIQNGADWFLTRICTTSVTINGASGDVLGCFTPDTLRVTTGGVVTGTIEGAGGADIIVVDGDGVVTGVVHGGGEGADVSAAQDSGDIITINTTGMVGGVDGDLGDDIITLLAGTIGNNVEGDVGDDVITLAGATIIGAVDGGAGDDAFVWSSGNLASFTGGDGSDAAVVTATEYDGTQLLDGGDDLSGADGFSDSLTLLGLSVTTSGANLNNWENIIVDGGTLGLTGTLAVGTAGETATGLTVTNAGVVDMGTTLTINGNVSVDAGATVDATGGGAGVYIVSGNVSNDGTLTAQDGAVGDAFTVNGDYAGGGTYLIDVDFSTDTTDVLVVNGDISGVTMIDAGSIVSMASGNVVLVVDVSGASPAGSFVLAGGAVTVGSFTYDLAQIGLDWYFTSTCNGDHLIDGVSSVSGTPGCFAADTITVTDMAAVTGDIEGAGGEDIITVSGSASVNGIVHGGEAGADASSAFDAGDFIVINTTGVVGGVDGDLGDDIINLQAGTISNNVEGDVGNDVISLAGARVIGVIDGGAGDDGFVWSSGKLMSFAGGDGSDTAVVTAAEFDGTQVLDGGDDLSVADGFTDSLTLQSLSLTTSGGNLTNWENIIVDGGTLGLTGMLDVGTASEAATGLKVTNAGVVDMGTALIVNGNVSVDAGAILDGTGGGAGVYALNGNIANNGLITSQDGVVGDVVTINGDYSGFGELNVDVVLGDSASPSDQIIINGDVTGTTAINVTNVGGAGALTGTGPSDGIQIVDVSGTAEPGAFVLGGPVSTGAFNYGLVQGGDQNWYLQSALQGQVYGYSALQAVLGDELETLKQRVGPREQLLNRDGSVSTSASGFWTRTSLSDIAAEGKTSVGGGGVANNLHYSRNLVQLGYDQQMFDDADGMLVAGVFGHYKRHNLDVDDATGSNLAKADADGYGGGLSVTWYSPAGFYADLVGQVTMWGAKVKAATGAGSFDVMTYSASVETGYRFNLDDSARLVPQAQIVWRGSKYDKFTDSSGLVVNWNEKGAFTGRIGIALEGGNPVSKNGNGLTGYVIANLVHDFRGAGTLSAAGTKVKTVLNSTRVEGRMGANLSGDDGHWTFYGEAGIASAISGKEYTSFKGIVGARWSF